MLAEAQLKDELVTGLIYINPNVANMFDLYNLPEEPLNRARPDQLRPSVESLEMVNNLMF